MGEWSKKIGEYGEKVIENFFEAIGWSDLSKGIELPCINGKKHLNDKGNPKQTHGIDFLYSYINPLVSAQLNNVLISSKFQNKKYPNNPSSTFKAFIDDLIETLECFDGSESKSSISLGFQCSTINDVGVLFWLNNQLDSNDDLILSVSNSRIADTQTNKTIFVMDNKRVAFILEIMKYIKMKSEKFDYSFYYPNTGQNLNPQGRQNVGKVLPVEFLNSSIIPIRLENKDNPKEKCLFLATIDSFEEDDFTRLMGLAKDITTDLAGEVIIAFPDYNELTHKNLETSAKQKFSVPEFTKTVSVVNFTNSLNIF
jgi:hypothetical protein